MSIKRILVVDDSNTERHLIGTVLTNNGYEVSFAIDGQAGVEAAIKNKPDLIVMDVVMPGLNGFQATRAITKDPETAHIPILLCTTKDQETDKVWGLRQGAKDYITKPVDAKELITKITQWMPK
jgi:twitching motility two-component system response regulator PilH